jgi:hypothetical protein
MKEIPLTKGRIALVDDEDYDFLTRWKWQFNADGYAVHSTHVAGKAIKIPMHRMIMNAQKGEIIDHINGSRLDNQRANLRRATRAQNAQNSIQVRNWTGYKGVQPLPTREYLAAITVDSREIHLGIYPTPARAAQAYDKAAVAHFGSDAMTNEKFLSILLKNLRET